jgi:hypothetical protein
MWSFFKVTNCELWLQIGLPTWWDDEILIFFAILKPYSDEFYPFFWYQISGKSLEICPKNLLKLYGCFGIYFLDFRENWRCSSKMVLIFGISIPQSPRKRIFFSSWFTKILKLSILCLWQQIGSIEAHWKILLEFGLHSIYSKKFIELWRNYFNRF